MQIQSEGSSDSVTNFEDKRKALFDCLETAEKSLKGSSLEQQQTNVANPYQRERAGQSGKSTSDLRSDNFKGKESIFKRPDAPITKCLRPRRVPDYQINPHKWKKYSLSDSDISDKTNTAAAFAFLKEIEDRKCQQKQLEQGDKSAEEAMDIGDTDAKIKFHKRKRSHEVSFNASSTLKAELNTGADDEKDPCEKAIMKGTKVVQAEYVVGQKTKKKSHRMSKDRSTIGSGTSLKLDHLLQEDEEREDDD